MKALKIITISFIGVLLFVLMSCKCGEVDSPHEDCATCAERPGDTKLLRECSVCNLDESHKKAGKPHQCAHGHTWN